MYYSAGPVTARPSALAAFPALAPRVGRLLLHPLDVGAVEEEAEAAASSAMVVSLIVLTMLVEVDLHPGSWCTIYTVRHATISTLCWINADVKRSVFQRCIDTMYEN